MSTGSNQPLSFAAPLYPIDKTVFRPLVARASVPQNATPIFPVFTTTQIINPINDYMFIDMQISTDGNTWYDIGNEPFYYDAGFMLSFKRFAAYWSVETDFITLGFTANDAAYNFYYRLVGVSKD